MTSQTVSRGRSLDGLLDPAKVAVVGASDNPASIGGRIIAQLKKGFSGAILPVNPKNAEIQGLAAYPDILSIDAELEDALAIVAARGELVPEIVADCAARGLRGIVVLSAGFAETGDAGAERQAQVAQIVRDNGIRLLGPNCLGFINIRAGLHATFTAISFEERPGPVAIIGQSGAFGIGVYELLLARGLGVSLWAATGNELDVSAGELALHAVEDDGINCVGVIVEGVRGAADLLAAGRRGVELGKPVIAMKVGGSPTGAAAARSHTAALAVQSEVFAAAAESAGLVTVGDARELIDAITASVPGRFPKGRRVALMSGSGGNGVMMADAADAQELDVPAPGPDLAERLRASVPSFGSVANPIDYTGNMINDPSGLTTIIEAVCDSDEYDIVCFAGVPRTLGAQYRANVVAGVRRTDKPFFVYAHQPDVQRILVEEGVATNDEPHALIRAVRALVDFSEAQARAAEPVETPAVVGSIRPNGQVLAEHAAQDILRAYGVPVAAQALVADAEAAVAAAREIAGPVAMKISAPWLPHKSDHAGLHLNVLGEDAIRRAYAELEAVATELAPSTGRDPFVLVQQMAPAGIELAIGLVRDPTFGPIVSLAAGGVLVEIIAEQALALAPFSRAHAQRLVNRIWKGRLAGHRRGLSGAAAATVADVAYGIGQLAIAEPAIAEIDINPLIASGDQVVAVDALIVCHSADA